MEGIFNNSTENKNTTQPINFFDDWETKEHLANEPVDFYNPSPNPWGVEAA